MFSLGRLALLPNGLRAKFIAAFACMSILPFLVCVYIILTFVFPFSESLWLTSTILLLTMLIAYCGFHLMDEIVNSIIALSRTARRLVPHAAAGLQAHPGGDEVTAIKQSLSTLAEDVERKTLKMRQLETTDEKIGIFTERHLRALLVEELKRAALYQRPCAFVVVRFKSRPGTNRILADAEHGTAAVRGLAGVVKRYTTKIEKVGRMGPAGVGIILPECNRQQAIQTAERIVEDAASFSWGPLSAMADWGPEIAVSVVSAPVDGVDPAILIKKCLTSLPA